jgi:hypothetical protein
VPNTRTDRATLQLGLAALAIAALFGILVAVLPIWVGQPSTPPPPNAHTEPVGWSGALLALAFVVAACLPFRPYALAQHALGGAAVPTRLLLGLTVGVALVAMLMYPAFGSDIFDYAGFERMWIAYGDNPLLSLPINHPQDWLSPFVWYPDRTPAYGPLWALLTWPIVRLAGESATGIVVGYKLLSIGAYAACCWFIWDTLGPERRQRGLITFAWSPLILFEVLGKVHNDVLPAVAMLAAVWLMCRPGVRALSLSAGVAGGLIKITALAVAPAIVVCLWRRTGRLGALLACALAALLILALYAPFWQGPQVMSSIWLQTSRVLWSPTSLLILASNWLPGGPYPSAVRVLFGLVWLTGCAALVFRRRLAQPVDLAATSGWALVLSVFLMTSAVYGHYLVPAVALAAVADDERLRRLVFWLSVGGQAAYGVDLLGLTLGPAWLGSDPYRVVGTLVLIGPALLMLLHVVQPAHEANEREAEEGGRIGPARERQGHTHVAGQPDRRRQPQEPRPRPSARVRIAPQQRKRHQPARQLVDQRVRGDNHPRHGQDGQL